MPFCSSIAEVEGETQSSRKSSGLFGFLKRGSGRVSDVPDSPPAVADIVSRDGLHSAPSGESNSTTELQTEPPKPRSTHSAPPERRSHLASTSAQDPDADADALETLVSHTVPDNSTSSAMPTPREQTVREQAPCQPEQTRPAVAPAAPADKKAVADGFVIEGNEGVRAAEVDAYLENIIGSRIVKELRATEWASRVHALEALQKLFMKPRSTATQADREALFKASITVLTRLLQDKVVPVFLPAIQGLCQLYSHAILASVPVALARSALHHFAGQLVLRSGSSNVRAREESANALRILCRSQVGAKSVCPYSLRPLTNRKSQHAAIGRLDLLIALLSEFGVAEDRCGISEHDLLSFVTPFCESSSDKVRTAATTLLGMFFKASPVSTRNYLADLTPPLDHLLLKLDGAGTKAPTRATFAAEKRLPLANAATTKSKLPPLSQDPDQITPREVPCRTGVENIAATSPIKKKKSRKPVPISSEEQATQKRKVSASGRGLFDDVDEELMEAILDIEEMP